MALNVEGGIGRLVAALRVLGRIWGWGATVCLALYLALSGNPAAAWSPSDLLFVVGLGLVLAGIPAGILIGLAWLLAGFIEAKR